jgi:drug/metabolite transporter (DMT)-like permease
MLALGIAAALFASILFNVGIALQGLEARGAPTSLSLRLSILGLLVRRRRWLLGLVLGIVGVAPQVVAYGLAPFVIVQPALACGLLVLLVIGTRAFHEPVGWREVVGVLGIIGGIALVSWGAPPRVEAHRAGAAAIAVVAGLSFVGVVPFALRGTRFDTAALAMVASGSGFGATNIATKLFGDAFGAGQSVAAAIWAVVALVIGILATVTGMTAFQRAAATVVVPVTTSVQTFLPIVLEPFFLREHWSAVPAAGVPLGGGLLLGLCGTVLTGTNRALARLAAGPRRSRRTRRRTRKKTTSGRR